MHGRSFHTGPLGVAILLISGAALGAEHAPTYTDRVLAQKSAALAAPSSRPASLNDPNQTDGTSAHATSASQNSLDSDAMFDAFDADSDGHGAKALMVDRADWAPEHAARAPVAVLKPPAAPMKKAAREDDGLDPEGDGIVTVPSASPSNDPLDRPKADVAPNTDGAGKTDAASAAQPLAPLNAAIKAALDKRGETNLKSAQAAEKKKEREAIAQFYAAHDYAPAWSEDGKPVAAVESILARLAGAGEDALDVAAPKTPKTEGKPEDQADDDIALTEAVVSYARQASGSRVDPHAISALIGAKPELADPAEVLDTLVLSGEEAGDKLRAMNPGDARYAVLRGKLAELRATHAPTTGPVTSIPAGPTLIIGMHDKRVPLIRSRLKLEAPLDGEDGEFKYDSEVAAAVADFQRANGLPPSGALTKKTVAALTGEHPSSSRLESTIIANMEMWRWMPHDLGADRIEVNIPEYTVTVFHEGAPVSQNRVVVGKTDTPTPLFSNAMKFLIVNPVWNVPVSIIKNEFLPKGGGDLSYLTSRGFQVSYLHGMPVVKQLAGAKNALGRIKFMFPNEYSVYLHDTPSKSLFSSAKRAFSHGCVRVDKPFDFAEIVLNQTVPEGGKMLWSQTRLEKMLGDKERYVYLPKPLPIHIEYFTAIVDEDSGNVTTREDIYGYTASVAAALGLSGDIGPLAERITAEAKAKRVVERAPRRIAERAYRRSRDEAYDDPGDPGPVSAPAPRTPSLFGIW